MKYKHRCYTCDKLFNEDEIELGTDEYCLELEETDKEIWECEKCRNRNARKL